MSKKKIVRIEDFVDEDLRFLPEETPLEWLERNTRHFLASICAIAVNPSNSPKCRLDAWKLLLNRSLPERAIHDIVTRPSEFDMMSDEEMRDYLTDYLAKLEMENPPEEND